MQWSNCDDEKQTNGIDNDDIDNDDSDNDDIDNDVIANEQVSQVLKDAESVGMMTAYHNYLITNLVHILYTLYIFQ